MTSSDIIEVLSIITSTIIGVISIYYSNKAIKIASDANKLTAEITAETNRPVVVAYLETVEIESFHKYMVIKNFGNTPATILDLKFMQSIDEYDFNMSSLIGYTIAPSQKFMHVIDNDLKGTVIVNIIYQTVTGQNFDEVYQVKLNATEKLFWIGSNDQDKQLKFMKNAAEAFIKVLK
ncbi:hypothetical protein EI220_03980 [Streptococcus suis]|uniref:Uncharacterized protein n=2 Tax=Streptococcus suis TaxID=1307 RepID=A0A426G9T2_STRSU|nr:hypothetical protein [Streptococcus suis]RRN51701.1 hypothetical protein EI220_03980 [Streptococcus suis]HEP1801689.1 hypothetical protein [Streptococcus suis]